MAGLPGWALKLASTTLTLVVAAGAAGYVSAHVKSNSAPMHPSVLSAQVRSGEFDAVTSTYAS